MERSKEGMEDDELVYYASVLQKLRKELGFPPANFSHMDIDEDITKKRSNKEKEFGT
jgi:hypothetical protein